MKEENHRLRTFVIGLLAAGLLFYLLGVEYGNGYLLGAVVSVIVYEGNLRFWNRIVDSGSAGRGTGMPHFMLNMALWGTILLVSVYRSSILNIFTAALGLTMMKAAVLLEGLIKGKGNQV